MYDKYNNRWRALMTKSEMFRTAHEIARRDRKLPCAAGVAYKVLFTETLQTLYADLRSPPKSVGNFEIKEPWYKAKMYDRRTGMWS